MRSHGHTDESGWLAMSAGGGAPQLGGSLGRAARRRGGTACDPKHDPEQTRIGTATGRTDDHEPDQHAGQPLADAHQRGHGVVHLGAEVPAARRDRGRRHRYIEIDGQCRQGRLVGEMVALRGHALDVAADRGQLILDLEHVADRGRLVHDLLERGLGRPQVVDARIQVDHLRGDVAAVGRQRQEFLAHSAERRQGVVPALGRNAVGDAGARAVVRVRLL